MEASSAAMCAAPTAPGPDFTAVVSRLHGVEGWLTLDQAEVLFDAARAVPAGRRVVEIGSFRGRSTTVLALAAGPDVEVVAIDPHAGNDRGPNELDGFDAEAARDHAAFDANLAAAGLSDRVRHVRATSHDALDEVPGPVRVLFIDGAHRYRPALDDLDRWGDRVEPGGEVLVHDAFSSIGVTLALGRSMLASRRFRYLGRTGSLARYRAERLRGADARLANAGRQLAELPWFARNVAVKLLIVAGLSRLTRYLGHPDSTWPY
jgi:predicted O-methyltransferase YrrM